jgi:hypothetical protein
VRADVEASFQPLRLARSSQHVAHRAFPVGASDVHGAEFVLWVAQMLAQSKCIGQIFFVCHLAHPLVHGQPGEKEIERFFVIHRNEMLSRLHVLQLFIHRHSPSLQPHKVLKTPVNHSTFIFYQ